MHFYDAPRDELVLVEGYRHLAVSRDGRVYNRSTNSFYKPYQRHNYSAVIATSLNGVKTVFKHAFLLTAAFIPIPVGFILPRDESKLEIGYHDDDHRNLELNNLYWVIKPDIPFLLSEAAGDDRIFEVPSVPAIGVDRHGNVFNLTTGNQLKLFKDDLGGYLSVFPGIKGTVKNYLHHRLMAELFVPPKEGYTIEQCLAELEVNHKNSIRDDNRPENLDWVTSKENSDHAYDVGFHTKSVKIVLKEVNTGKIQNFRSINQASKLFGLFPWEIVTLHKNKVMDKMIINGFIVKFVNSGLDFLDLSLIADDKEPYYRFLKHGTHRITARLKDIECLLPGPVSYVNEDGSIGKYPKPPYRVNTWTIQR